MAVPGKQEDGMVDGNERIVLTARDIQAWKDRKAELDRQVADAQRELAVINRNLEAAAVLLAQKGSTVEGTATEPSAADTDEDDGFGSPVAG
jgi:hypothetical protein